MKTKDILCDSGAFISLTTTCLDNLVYFFAEQYGVRFIIPPSVEEETVTYPLNAGLKKYAFSAIRILDMMNDGVVVKSDIHPVEEARRIMNYANNMFFVRGKPLRLLHQGEAEIIAAAKRLGIEYILIDERTTRMLIEAPFTVKKHLEQEFGVNVMLNKQNLASLSQELSGMHALRSSELVILAYEKGYFKRFQSMELEALKAALYRTKFSGCSISFKEIDAYLAWKE